MQLRCSDQGKIWHGGQLMCAKFHPYWCRSGVWAPRTVNFTKFGNTNTHQGCIPCTFLTTFSVCGYYQSWEIHVLLWSDSPHGYRSYWGFTFRAHFPQNSGFPSGNLVQNRKVQKWYGLPLSQRWVQWGLGLHAPWVGLKNLMFFVSFCLSLFKRSSLWMHYHHDAVFSSGMVWCSILSLGH